MRNASIKFSILYFNRHVLLIHYNIYCHLSLLPLNIQRGEKRRSLSYLNNRKLCLAAAHELHSVLRFNFNSRITQ